MCIAAGFFLDCGRCFVWILWYSSMQNMRNWFFSVADLTKLTTLLEWDNKENFAWALSVCGYEQLYQDF